MNEKREISIVILYSTIVHYVIGMLKVLRETGLIGTIDVVYWDKKGDDINSYKVEEVDGVTFYPRSSLDDKRIFNLLYSRKPTIVYVSGWMDKGYLRAIRKYRKEGGKFQVVCGIDDQWKGSLRQRFGQIYFYLFYKQLFDFMWVAGKEQYHYAQRFGYTQEKIICNLLSADTARFRSGSLISGIAKRFVYVGRFVPVKGLDLLLDAYNSLPEEIKSAWPLVLIGDGPLKNSIEKRASKNISIMPYLQPEKLVNELVKGGIACIPSYQEAWGVAIHEMALMGFPLILSSACGAASEFLISGYNGYMFKSGDSSSLREALLRISCLTSENLKMFSKRSCTLAQRITSEHAAYSLLSTLYLANM